MSSFRMRCNSRMFGSRPLACNNLNQANVKLSVNKDEAKHNKAATSEVYITLSHRDLASFRSSCDSAFKRLGRKLATTKMSVKRIPNNVNAPPKTFWITTATWKTKGRLNTTAAKFRRAGIRENGIVLFAILQPYEAPIITDIASGMSHLSDLTAYAAPKTMCQYPGCASTSPQRRSSLTQAWETQVAVQDAVPSFRSDRRESARRMPSHRQAHRKPRSSEKQCTQCWTVSNSRMVWLIKVLTALLPYRPAKVPRGTSHCRHACVQLRHCTGQCSLDQFVAGNAR
mmetsp:Transcript_20715/g.65332  ORF Transcript_20715/g.65332 Transcript_20715/m.65332 type:complete len:285 (-) Transcript_20715:912-1766(-)